MKKIISVLLAMILICSSVAALATTTTTTGSVMGGSTKDFIQTPTPTMTSNSQKTQMWVRVAASGQINCTIPLVLVFDTNIDGGEATISKDNYYITNNSTAPIVVTNVVPAAQSTSVLTLKKYADVADDDTYAVKLGNIFSSDYDLGDTSASFQKAPNATGLTHAEKGGKLGIDVTAKFSKLTFVTGVAAADGVTQDKSKGVHFLDVTYTVAIDRKSVV